MRGWDAWLRERHPTSPSSFLSLSLLFLPSQAGVEQVPLAGLQIIRGDNMCVWTREGERSRREGCQACAHAPALATFPSLTSSFFLPPPLFPQRHRRRAGRGRGRRHRPGRGAGAPAATGDALRYESGRRSR